MRRHGSMMVVLSGLLAASPGHRTAGRFGVCGRADGWHRGRHVRHGGVGFVGGQGPRAAGYKRTQFGKAWADVDHNGCDTRNDILNRDLTGVRHKWRTHNCVVKSGKLHDPLHWQGHQVQEGQEDFHRGADRPCGGVER